MTRFPTLLTRFGRWWLLGFTTLVLLGPAMATAGVVAYLLILLLGVMFGWSEGLTNNALYASVILWAPAGIGCMVSSESFRSVMTMREDRGPHIENAAGTKFF